MVPTHWNTPNGCLNPPHQNHRTHMRKILVKLYILQEVDNRKREVKLGKGFFTAIRLNPYNPLAWLYFIGATIVGFIMYGLVGFWKEIDYHNPFKWR